VKPKKNKKKQKSPQTNPKPIVNIVHSLGQDMPPSPPQKKIKKLQDKIFFLGIY
jgi:hypothetical protein